MAELKLNPIGKIVREGEDAKLVLDKAYAPALTGLNGFSHIQVLWWFSEFDDEKSRSILTATKPYKRSPDALGIFATRSPVRPNPIALDCAQVTYIDCEHATIGLAYIDAFDRSPVLDIKPYTPSIDRVERPITPEWCAHWPKSLEKSGNFDWAGEFNF